MAGGNLASVRSAAPPLRKVCLVGWGHPVLKTVTRHCRGGSTPLPSAMVQWCTADAGPSTGRSSDRHRPASTSRRHRIMEVRRVLNPEAGGRYPVAVPERTTGLLVAMRSSSAVERVVVTHRRRGFETSLRSPGAVTEDSGTRLQPGPRWCNSSRRLHAVVAQWQSVSLPTRRSRGRDPPTARRGQGVDRYTRGFHPRVNGGGTH